MKKSRGIETPPLPEAMIQHLQSFMSGKEAARTTLISKSWYNAWLTCPALDFDDRYFRKRSSHKFEEFATKTMQRYQDLSLKIDSFRLSMCPPYDKKNYFVDKLVVNALKIGATDVHLEIPYSFTVPQELLGSQTLVRLYLAECKVDGDYAICCSNLKSLTLKKVRFTSGSGDVLKDIMRCCCTALEELSVDFSFSSPSILPQEVLASQILLKLSLEGCEVDGNYEIRCSNLKSLTLTSVTVTSDVFHDIISCITTSIEELSLSSLFPLSRMNSYDLHKLRRLFLCSLDVGSMFSSGFVSRFPCLNDLSIIECHGCRKIQIASTSLQTISLKPMSGSWSAKFDVPNIRKFTYSGSCLPSDKLSIKASSAASREWEFDVSISCNQLYKRSWFLNLKKYLSKLRLSRLSLSIKLSGSFRHHDHYSEHEVDIEVVAEPLVVENFIIKAPYFYCSALLIHNSLSAYYFLA